MTVTEYYFIYGITLSAETLYKYLGAELDLDSFFEQIHYDFPECKGEIKTLNPIYKKYKEFQLVKWCHDIWDGDDEGLPRVTLGIRICTVKNPSGFIPKPSPAQLEKFEKLKADLEKAFNTKLEEEPSVVLLANDCHCCS